MKYIHRELEKQVARRRARAEGKSLNEVTAKAPADSLGLGKECIALRDLSDIVGTWKREASVEAALIAQDAVGESVWK